MKTQGDREPYVTTEGGIVCLQAKGRRGSLTSSSGNQKEVRKDPPRASAGSTSCRRLQNCENEFLFRDATVL